MACVRLSLEAYARTYAHSARSVRMKRSALLLVRGRYGRVKRCRMRGLEHRPDQPTAVVTAVVHLERGWPAVHSGGNVAQDPSNAAASARTCATERVRKPAVVTACSSGSTSTSGQRV